RTLEMFGCSRREQIVGHRPHEFSPPVQPDGRDSLESATEKIAGAMAGERQFFEWLHTRVDGSLFLAEVSLITVEVRSGKMLQAVVRDISRRREAEEKIRELNTDLERRVEQRTAELLAANEELEAFSYSVSHDLRAPLRAINSFSQLLVKNHADQLDADGREMLGYIHRGAQHMSSLIDDLLSFSRLGRQELQPAEIAMQVLAREVFDELAKLEPGRDLRLDLHPIPNAFGTEAMIRQVWVNLIGNAIKFTSEREISRIEIGSEDSPDDLNNYYVKDNGAGFDMQNAGRLFGVFQRLHSVDEFEGTGVGLALVQRVIQRNGGEVWAEAEVGAGATFHFTLPGWDAQQG
ncbi:MAG: sensor histidine kinase, partial [Verrucomicrobiales bacterium]